MNGIRKLHEIGAIRENAVAPLGDVMSPAVQLSQVYLFQSYFDSTLLERAILEQAANQPIVESTRQRSDIRVYAIGLHPSSQAPVAVSFTGDTDVSASGVYILKPGQIIRPSNRKRAFAGFEYGLPFGWLGGGSVTLIAFTSPETEVAWPSNDTEIIFHRSRYQIRQPADLVVGTTTAPKNWPLRFPWTQALFGTDSIPQKGKALVSIAEPTRALLVLRGFSSTAAFTSARVRLVFQATNDFGLDSAGAIVLTNPIFDEVVFPIFASLGAAGNLATQNPVVEYVSPLRRLAADDGGIVIIDNSDPAASLTGGFVDIVRYGKL